MPRRGTGREVSRGGNSRDAVVAAGDIDTSNGPEVAVARRHESIFAEMEREMAAKAIKQSKEQAVEHAQRAWEQRAGVAVYLGQSAPEMKETKPWLYVDPNARPSAASGRRVELSFLSGRWNHWLSGRHFV